MNTLPLSLKKIALFFERLPGIGEKTANRLAFYLLRMPEADLKEFAENVNQLKSKTKYCEICMNLTEEKQCAICSDPKRDKSVITVVESALDLLAFEQGGIYNGVYHVLHGKIDPLNNIGPDDIYINSLLNRINELTSSPDFAKASSGERANELKEIVLATNPDMEGEATAMYIKNKINELTSSPDFAKASSGERINEFSGLRITRLAYGLPLGANLEYADYGTLKKAMDGRNKF